MGRKQNIYKDSNGYYFKANLGKDPITGKRLTKTKRGFKTEAEAYREYMVFMLNQTNDQVVSDSYSNENMTFKDFRIRYIWIGINRELSRIHLIQEDIVCSNISKFLKKRICVILVFWMYKYFKISFYQVVCADHILICCAL